MALFVGFASFSSEDEGLYKTRRRLKAKVQGPRSCQRHDLARPGTIYRGFPQVPGKRIRPGGFRGRMVAGSMPAPGGVGPPAGAGVGPPGGRVGLFFYFFWPDVAGCSRTGLKGPRMEVPVQGDHFGMSKNQLRPNPPERTCRCGRGGWAEGQKPRDQNHSHDEYMAVGRFCQMEPAAGTATRVRCFTMRKYKF